MQRTIASAPQAGAELYTRQASGFVRELSLSGNVVTTLCLMSFFNAVLVVTQAPSFFPGANPVWTTLLAALLAVFPTALFAYFLLVMPRSGGDYVFMSRTLGPWVGFATNFAFIAWIIIGAAFSAYYIAPFGISPALAAIGTTAHSKTMLEWSAEATSKNWGFGIGAAYLIFSAAVLSLKIRRVIQVMWAILGLTVLGLLISLVLLIFNDHQDFVHAVSGFHASYSKIIADGRAAGYHAHVSGAHFALGATLLAMPIAFGIYGYTFFGAYVGSELRSPRRNGRRAMFIALGIAAALGGLLTILMVSVFGTDFLGAATILSNAGNKAYPFSAPSFPFFYVSMLAGSTFLEALIGISFVAATAMLVIPSLMMATRALFAWSFDRIMPIRAAEVNERTHSPIIANISILIFSLAGLAFVVYAQPSLLGLFFTTGFAQVLCFCVLGVAGLVFPFRRKALYATLPGRRYLGRVPTMTIVAAAAIVYWGFIAYVYAVEDVFDANSTQGWIAIGVLWGLGILIYPYSRWRNARRGIDLDLAFRELPPE
jgi:amino acid transporter